MVFYPSKAMVLMQAIAHGFGLIRMAILLLAARMVRSTKEDEIDYPNNQSSTLLHACNIVSLALDIAQLVDHLITRNII